MTKARLDKVQNLLVTELEERLEDAVDAIFDTAQEEDVDAFETTLYWFLGMSHGKRPPREVVAKAFALRERFTPDIIELRRRIAIARGNPYPQKEDKQQ